MRKRTSRIIIFTVIACTFLLSSLEGCSKTAEKVKEEEDSVRVAAGEQYKKNFIHNFLFGKHYRDLWAEQVKLPVFDLQKEKGGLTPVKVGGSQQTISIHLVDTAGRRYVLRSVDKDQSKALPQTLRNTIISQIFIDQTSALNPYGAMIVDNLAEAAGIHHTNPQYFYVPEQKGFEEYGKEVMGTVAMLEEKPNSSWAEAEVFGYPNDIIETDNMVETLYKNPYAFVDDELFLRSRLFDFVINDWDRHGNQWEWLENKRGDSIVYQPLPRDRDMAFYMFDDGLLPFIASRWWGNPKFQSFHRYYEYVPGMIINSKELDNLLLEDLTWETWNKLVCDIQKNLSDEVIEKAVKSWPESVYEERGEETILKLKERRDRLTNAAWQFYTLINENICILGTDEAEYVKIERLPDGNTYVKVESKVNSWIHFERILDPEVTDKIIIATLAGNDEIMIEGKAEEGITIHIHGGQNQDTITDISHVKGVGRKTRIYYQKDDLLTTGGESAINIKKPVNDEQFTYTDF